MIAPAFGVLFDGFAYGMLLFLLSVGLSVTLGMMNFVNLAHGSFAMLGAYVTVTLMALRLAVLRHVALRVPGRRRGQRGVRAHAVPPAVSRERSPAGAADAGRGVHLGGRRRLVLRHDAAAGASAGVSAQLYDRHRGQFQHLRLFLIAVALAITVLLVATLEYTRFGAQVRAAVDNQRMALGLGIDVDGVFAITFALGSGLAGLGGALAIEIVGLDPNFAFTYLIYVLIVVAVGGLGSIRGSLLAAIVLGVSDAAGKYYVPTLGAFLIYLVMVSLLLWRPSGLFGRR